MKRSDLDKLLERLSNKKEDFRDMLTKNIPDFSSQIKQSATKVTVGSLALFVLASSTNAFQDVSENAFDINTNPLPTYSAENKAYNEIINNITDKTTLVTGTTKKIEESTKINEETTIKYVEESTTNLNKEDTTSKSNENATENIETTTQTPETTTQPQALDFQGVIDGDSKVSFYGSAKVMSFNVRYIQEEKNPINNWDNRKEVLVNQIEEYDPDIIGFQEIQLGHLDYFKENLEGYTYYYFSKIEDPDRCTQAIFFKTRKYQCFDSGKFWISETPDKISKGWDANSYRIATYCTLREIGTRNEFNFYCIHLDHKGEIAREKGAQMIVDHINEMGKPAIVVGDFNIGEDSKMYEIMSSNLNDAKYVAEDVKNTSNTYNAWNQPQRQGDDPIDFILYTDGFKVKTYQVLNQDLGNVDNYEDKYYASDHFAVVSDVGYDFR